MPKLDAMLAPRALTALEIAEVAAPQLIAYGVAHRAFIHTGIIVDGENREGSTVYAAESALELIVADAAKSVEQWLGDCSVDGEPRFYQKGALKCVIGKLCYAAAQRFVAAPEPSLVADLVDSIEDRDRRVLEGLVAEAAE